MASSASFCASKSFIRGESKISTSTVSVRGFVISVSMLMFSVSIRLDGTFDRTYSLAAFSAAKHSSSICSLVNSGKTNSTSFT